MKIGEFLTIPTGPFVGQLGEVEEIFAKTIRVRLGNMHVEVDRDMLAAIEQAEEGEAEGTKRPRK